MNAATITMQTRFLAETPQQCPIIRFRDHSSARRAFESPEPVRNNRFVRLDWHSSTVSPHLKRTLDNEQTSNKRHASTSEFYKIERYSSDLPQISTPAISSQSSLNLSRETGLLISDLGELDITDGTNRSILDLPQLENEGIST